MIPYNEYQTMTRGNVPFKSINEQGWWSEDYIIGGKLIRFSGLRILDKETISYKLSEWVHCNDMGDI